MKPLYILVFLVIVFSFGWYVYSKNKKENQDMPGKYRDLSNKNAPKVIKSKDIKSFHTHFVYFESNPGAPRRVFRQFAANKLDAGEVELENGAGSNNKKVIVGEDFLVELQEIIDWRKLAKWNGDYKVTSGLPTEPTSFSCKYESGESISFCVNNNPYSEWMADIVDLFDYEFKDNDEKVVPSPDTGITRFYFKYTGASREDSYSFEIEKDGEQYILKAFFFDSERTQGYVDLVWDSEEYQEIIKGLYARLEQIYLDSKIYKWDGFERSDPFVKDGHVFEIQIDLEDGKRIEARGSNSYPKGFMGLMKGLRI